MVQRVVIGRRGTFTMKKVVHLVLAAVVVLAVLACSGTPSPPPSSRQAAGQAAVDSGRRIALLYVSEGSHPEVNKRAFIGISRFVQEFGGSLVGDNAEVSFGSSVEVRRSRVGSGPEEMRRALSDAAREGYGLIIGLGFLFEGPIRDVAAKFPASHFVGIDCEGAAGSAKNLTFVRYRIDQACFLAGVAAARVAGKGSIGFIGGMDIPVIRPFAEGYFRGTAYARPELERPERRQKRYLGTFQDEEAAYRSAREMYTGGADVVFQAAGLAGWGVFRAAAEAQRWSIGVDIDQGLVLALSADDAQRRQSRWVLTSALKRYDETLYRFCRLSATGQPLPVGSVTVDLRDGDVGIAVNPYNQARLAPFQEELERLRAQIAAGTFDVSTGRAVAGAAQPAPAATAPAGARQPISVLDLGAEAGVSTAEALVLSEILASALLRTGRHLIIARDQRQRLLEEIEFSLSDAASAAGQLEVGRLIAAQAIVTGRVGRVGKSFVLDAKKVEVQTGMTLAAATARAPSVDGLLERMSEIATDLSGP